MGDCGHTRTVTEDRRNLPLDGEPRYSRLLSKNVATDTLDDRLCRRLLVEFLCVVFIVDVVADSHEFSAVVGAGEEDDCDTKDLGRWKTCQIGRVGLEYELVDANGNGTNE
jgi:hypothetical protein